MNFESDLELRISGSGDMDLLLDAENVDYGQKEFPTYMTLDKASSVHNERLTVVIATKPEHKHIAEKYQLAMTKTQWNIVLVDSLAEAESLCNEKGLSFLQEIES